MYTNLHAGQLGITGRQSEIIELALTFGFKGIDVDVPTFVRQAESRGAEQAGKLLVSSKLNIGPFDLPLLWQGEEEEYKAELAKLPALASMMAGLGATTCVTTIEPASDLRPYHEQFETLSARLVEITELLAPHNLRLGLALKAPAAHREGRTFEFIHQGDALLLFVKTIGIENLGVVIDSWHWHVSGCSFEALSGLTAGEIVDVRLADVPSDADLATICEDKRVLPGPQSTIDFASLLQILEDLNYEGPITPAARPSDANTKGDNVVRAAAQAVKDAREPKVAEEELSAAGSESDS
jgi:sugar phosphate isomerase/epimerase